jgi:hypothetical protein
MTFPVFLVSTFRIFAAISAVLVAMAAGPGRAEVSALDAVCGGNCTAADYATALQGLGSQQELQQAMQDAAAQLETARLSYQEAKAAEQRAMRDYRDEFAKKYPNVPPQGLDLAAQSYIEGRPAHDVVVHGFRNYQRALQAFQAAQANVNLRKQIEAAYQAKKAEEAALQQGASDPAATTKAADQPPQAPDKNPQDEQAKQAAVAALVADALNAEALAVINEFLQELASGEYPSAEAAALLEDVSRQDDKTTKQRIMKEEVERHRDEDKRRKRRVTRDDGPGDGGGDDDGGGGGGLPPGALLGGIGMMGMGFGGMHGGMRGGGFGGGPHQSGGMIMDRPR